MSSANKGSFFKLKYKRKSKFNGSKCYWKKSKAKWPIQPQLQAALTFEVQFRVRGSGFGVPGSGFGVRGSGFLSPGE